MKLINIQCIKKEAQELRPQKRHLEIEDRLKAESL